MSAQIINLADARKARQINKDEAGAIFLLPLHVAAFFVEAWLDAISRAGWGGGGYEVLSP